MLFHNKPDYGHLQAFGCACFPLTRPFNRHKLEFRSRRCVFVGYSTRHKGYKCLDDEGKIIISRHVVFDESVFPMLNSKSQPSVVNDESVSVSKFPLVLVQGDDRLVNASGSGRDLSMGQPSCCHREPADRIGTTSGSSPACVGSSPELVLGQISDPTGPVLTRVQPNEEEGNTRLSPAYSPCFGQDEGVDSYLLGQINVFPRKVDDSVVEGVLILNRKLRQIDVNNAFLNGVLHEEVYMMQPPGYEYGDKERLVCKLHKSLYGLKQAPRAWFEKLKMYLVSVGFVLSKSDSSLFVRRVINNIVYLLVYVDDIVITGNDDVEVQEVISSLNKEFSLKDLGELNYFLGIEVSYDDDGLVLSQKKYIRELLLRSGLEAAKGLPTPMISNLQLSNNIGSPIDNVTAYRSIVGALQYIVVTRPEIAFAVNRVCQFMQRPLDTHFQAVKRILRYLQGTIDFGLRFSPTTRLDITVFANANWGSDVDDRRSTTGFCLFFGGNPVSWGAKKQSVVSRSTAEAEYRAVAYAAAEVVWL
ncbi:hypothetical protein V6N13_026406 [Hibiscus sabdariffa]